MPSYVETRTSVLWLPSLQLREQNNLTNRLHTEQKHDQPVNTNAQSTRRRHTILQSTHVIEIHGLAFVIAPGLRSNLLRKPFFLVYGVVEFGEGIGKLHPAGKKFETLDSLRLFRHALGKRRNFHGIIMHKRRVDEVGLNHLVEHFIHDVGIFERLVHMNAEFSDLTARQPIIAELFQTNARVLLHGLVERSPVSYTG